MNEISLWDSFKSQTKPIKTIVAILYMQYAFVLILAILMMATGSVGLLCLLLPYVLAHWVAEGILMRSRLWYILGSIYTVFTTLATSLIFLGATFEVIESGRTYLFSAPQTQINLLLVLIIFLYGLWASIFLIRQTPNKERK